MALLRDATRIPTDAAVIRIGATGGATADVGYMEEESLKETVKPIETTDENGNKMQIAVEYSVEFNMLQGDYTMWTDLDALVGANVDIKIVPYESASGNPHYKLTDIPFRYEVEAVWAKSKARTVKILATTKAELVTDIVSKVTATPT